MTFRCLTLIGLAFAAAAAMCGMAVSSAGAAQFTSSSGATSVEAKDTSNVKLTITGQNLTCNSGIFTGNAPSASFSSITVSVAFSECKTGIGTTATLTGFGGHGEPGICDFVFYASGKVDLICTAGQEVTIGAATCVAHIPGQIGLGTVSYNNNGKHVDAALNLTKITANHTDGFLCPFGSGGHSSEAAWESSSGLTFIPGAGTLSWDA